MFALFACAGGQPPPASPDSLARTLAAYCGVPRRRTGERTHFYWLEHRAVGVASASNCLLYGWIDNREEVERSLGTTAACAAALYAAAVDRWGDEADARLVGNYAAAVTQADGSVRLSRSPWESPALFWHVADGMISASTLLRVLFAAGVPQALVYERIADELAMDSAADRETTYWRRVQRVPRGSVIVVSPDGTRRRRDWYDLDCLPAAPTVSHEQAVERARTLLDEAAVAALGRFERPAIALSGGLDSPLVAEALLRHLPKERRLPSITHTTDPDWDGICAPGTIGDETPLVRAFAALHPRLEPHFVEPNTQGFDIRSRDIFAAGKVLTPSLAMAGEFPGMWSKAADLGCDALLTADLGNQSFSADGRWAYVEYLRSGRIGELLALLRGRAGDDRPMWRRFAAHSVLPLLPPLLRIALRTAAHPGRRRMTELLSPLSQAALAEVGERAAARGSKPFWDDATYPRDRRAAAALDLAQSDTHVGDSAIAFEQLYGVRHCDVTAYRPLIEYCLSLPTDHFVRAGEHRVLARSMAKGRMPEEQRASRLHGQHNMDWQARLGRERVRLLAYLDRVEDHPHLAHILDIERLRTLLTDWPEKTTMSFEEGYPRAMAIPTAVAAAQFVAHVEGRNDL